MKPGTSGGVSWVCGVADGSPGGLQSTGARGREMEGTGPTGGRSLPSSESQQCPIHPKRAVALRSEIHSQPRMTPANLSVQDFWEDKQEKRGVQTSTVTSTGLCSRERVRKGRFGFNNPAPRQSPPRRGVTHALCIS